MRNMEFKMERQGLLTVGQEVDVTESVLPTSYYYTIQPMIAMSKNYPGYERLQSRKGIVKDIKETDRGYYTVVEFDEEDIGRSGNRRSWNPRLPETRGGHPYHGSSFRLLGSLFR